MGPPPTRDRRERLARIGFAGPFVILALAGCGATDDEGGVTLEEPPDQPVRSADNDATLPSSTANATVAATMSTFVLTTEMPADEASTEMPTDGAPTESTAPAFEPSDAAEIEDSTVRALGELLAVDGELESHDGEFGRGQSIGRLEPRGISVNVPLWGMWSYWDLPVQATAGPADEDEAERVATALFVRLGIDPGEIVSVSAAGSMFRVGFVSGAAVDVAGGEAIAMIHAPTDLLSLD